MLLAVVQASSLESCKGVSRGGAALVVVEVVDSICNNFNRLRLLSLGVFFNLFLRLGIWFNSRLAWGGPRHCREPESSYTVKIIAKSVLRRYQ